ncbi:MAG: hypothetical protein ACOY4U_07275 [Pseudomonadota bacterium]
MRILFSGLAYTLMQQLGEMVLAGTELAHATIIATIRVKAAQDQRGHRA